MPALASHERLTEAKLRLLGDRVSPRTARQLARDHRGESLLFAEYLAITRLQADALLTVDLELVHDQKASSIAELKTLEGDVSYWHPPDR